MIINYMVAGVTTECIIAVNYSAFYIILLLYCRIHSEPLQADSPSDGISHWASFPPGFIDV